MKGFCNLQLKQGYSENCQKYSKLSKLKVSEYLTYYLCNNCLRLIKERNVFPEITFSQNLDKKNEYDSLLGKIKEKPIYKKVSGYRKKTDTVYIPFTQEEINWLKENSKNRTIKELRNDLFNIFDIDKSESNIRGFLNNNKIEYKKGRINKNGRI